MSEFILLNKCMVVRSNGRNSYTNQCMYKADGNLDPGSKAWALYISDKARDVTKIAHSVL